MKLNDYLKLIFLFAFFYIVLVLLWKFTDFFDWNNDPMFWIMPIAGFFLVYLVIDYIDNMFDINFSHTIFFPLAFFALCLISFYIVLVWHLGNGLVLQGAPLSTLFDELNKDWFKRYFEYLRDSAFIIFALSGVFGWLSHVIMEKISSKK